MKGCHRPHRHFLRNLFFFFGGLTLLIAGFVFLSVATIKIPDFRSFEERKVVGSTKIYDRTGEILLYDVHQDVRRTVIPYSEMGVNIKNATVAIEDSSFYQHRGIRLKSTLRALLYNLLSGKTLQGGSTITQQIIKNTLLTPEKTATRKIKEWILALKIENVLSKESILETYLNETPYGGNIYGVKEATQSFFNKEPRNLTLAEATYLAAIPKAPTFYSPYGKNREKLDSRKNLVLKRMLDLDFINEKEYIQAQTETVSFRPQEKFGIKAPHFVFFIKEYLEQKYGRDVVENSGLKVITTLDYEMQSKAEEIVLNHALENEKKFGGENGSMVALDPKTGQILVMVGSRDYFDKGIDGNYNVAMAKRQPGSSFKPFVYATAFKAGYTPDSIIFDLPTEFQTTCGVYGRALPGYRQDDCYSPRNYNGKFLGPISIKSALQQSINLVAVKMLYLVGVDESIKTAREMGLATLSDSSRYGLALVLGGGEVTLLDMTSAYGVFATGGIRRPAKSILKIENAGGKTLEEFQNEEYQVLPENIALIMSNVLSDNEARVPTFGRNSSLYVPGWQVAAKTGTTNNWRDGWLIGYTPSLSLGTWTGNNDNRSMSRSASTVAGPMWKEFMSWALQTFPERFPNETFNSPDIPQPEKPILRGEWLGGESFFIDRISGKLATEYTPRETKVEHIITNVHSELFWIQKDNPLGPAPENPANDPQFEHWEIPTQNWWAQNSGRFAATSIKNKPTAYDDVHIPGKMPIVEILNPEPNKVYGLGEKINVNLKNSGVYPVQKVDFFVNEEYLGSAIHLPFSISFLPNEVDAIESENKLRIMVTDSVFNTTEATMQFNVAL